MAIGIIVGVILLLLAVACGVVGMVFDDHSVSN